MASDINVLELLEKFNNDKDSQALIDKYYRKSFPELFAISRREVSHSSFLAKVFSEKSFHNLGTFPFLSLLRVMCTRARKQDNNSLNCIQKQLLTNSHLVGNVHIDTEVITKCPDFKKNGRADIVIMADIVSPDVQDYSSITVVIENKVAAKESDTQTSKYFRFFESIKSPGELIIYAYLTPKPSLELDELTKPECDCKEFIQINYQDILDGVLVPMRHKAESPRTIFILEEYINSLGISFEEVDSNDNKENTKKTIIMAISPEDRELLTAFFEHNKELIEASLEAISTDADQDDDVIEDAKSILTTIKKLNSRDTTKYLFNGQKLGKGKFVLAVITDYSLTHSSSKAILSAFCPKKTPIIKPAGEVKRKNNKKRFFDESSEVLHLTDGTYAVDHEWGQGNAFDKFLDQAKKAGYDISPIR